MQRQTLKLARNAALVSIVFLLAIAGSLYAAVTGWRSALPAVSETSQQGLAAVFFDTDVDTTLSRAEAALDLVREGRVNRVLLIGGARPERNFYGSEVLAKIMKSRDGAEAATWFADRSSFDTTTNLDALRTYLSSAPSTERVYLISDDYHLWRISWLTRRDPDLSDREVFVPVEQPRTLLEHADRIVWELGAWLFHAAPPPVHSWALTMTRG